MCRIVHVCTCMCPTTWNHFSDTGVGCRLGSMQTCPSRPHINSQMHGNAWRHRYAPFAWLALPFMLQILMYTHTLYTCTSVVVSGSRDATLRVWNVETGECTKTLSGHVAAVRWYASYNIYTVLVIEWNQVRNVIQAVVPWAASFCRDIHVCISLLVALAAWDSCSGIYCMSRLHFVPKEWLCIPCIHMCGLGCGKVTYTAKLT